MQHVFNLFAVRCVQIICKVMTGFRPEVPEGCPSGYADIMVACWCASYKYCNPDR